MDELTGNPIKSDVNLTKCWVDVANERAQYSMGYRDSAPPPLNPNEQTNCPPDGSPEMTEKLERHERLQNEMDGLYEQRSAITLGPS